MKNSAFGLSDSQYNKFLEIATLAKTGGFNLKFDTSIPSLPEYSSENLKAIADDLVLCAKELLKYKKSDSFFASKYSKQEIQDIVSSYYEMVLKIDALRQKIYSEADLLLTSIEQTQEILRTLMGEFSKFIPYKSALLSDERYSAQIEQISSEFDQNIKKIKDKRDKFRRILKSAGKICDTIIPNFLFEAENKLGTPPYNDFSAQDLFNCTTSFIEQINNENKKEM